MLVRFPFWSMQSLQLDLKAGQCAGVCSRAPPAALAFLVCCTAEFADCRFGFPTGSAHLVKCGAQSSERRALADCQWERVGDGELEGGFKESDGFPAPK